MQKSIVEKISFEEFCSNMTDTAVVSAIGCICNRPKDKPIIQNDYNIVDSQIDLEKDLFNDVTTIEKSKVNSISRGIIFGRCARSRCACNVAARSQQLRNEYKKALNPCFLTITFPYTDIVYDAEKHDRLFTALIQRYFKVLSKDPTILDWVWIAERHTSSERHKVGMCENSVVGRLHYHCIVFFNGFYEVQTLNKKWLNILKHSRKLIFPTKNVSGKDYQPITAEWLCKRNKGNTIDYSKLMAYIFKYVKKQNEEKFYSRCWGWSRGLSGISGKMIVDSELFLKEYNEKKIKDCYKITIQSIEQNEKILMSDDFNINNVEKSEELKSTYTIYVARIKFDYLNSNFLKYF